MLKGIRALLLVNAKGDVYVIQGGIRPYKQLEELEFENIDLQIAVDQAIQCESEARNEWGNRMQTDPNANVNENLGPRVFQAFNVLLPNPEDDQPAEKTANSGGTIMS